MTFLKFNILHLLEAPWPNLYLFRPQNIKFNYRKRFRKQRKRYSNFKFYFVYSLEKKHSTGETCYRLKQIAEH